MKKIFLSTSVLLTGLLLPAIADAQAALINGKVQILHQVLQNVYNQMIPLCSNLLTTAQGIAAFGTLFYIGYRVWRHIAKAEPVDFLPLLRPLVIYLLITIYPDALGVLNDILSPTVTATAQLELNSNQNVQTLLAQNDAILESGTDSTQVLIGPGPGTSTQDINKYAPDDSGTGGNFWSMLGSGFKFMASWLISALRLTAKFLLSVLLEILYYAASLCIDAVRTFHLIVLAILGPFVLAFSCYDGFQQSLTHWLAKYINVYLWLPIASIFGAILNTIQANMLQIDISRAQTQSIQLYSATDIAYLIFLTMGIIGYLTVPSLANYIVHSHIPNPIQNKIASTATTAVAASTGGASAGAAAATQAVSAASSSSGGGANQYNASKISGL